MLPCTSSRPADPPLPRRAVAAVASPIHRPPRQRASTPRTLAPCVAVALAACGAPTATTATTSSTSTSSTTATSSSTTAPPTTGDPDTTASSTPSSSTTDTPTTSSTTSTSPTTSTSSSTSSSTSTTGEETTATTGDPPDLLPTTCEGAALTPSTVGCRFYAVDLDAHDNVEDTPYAIGVANVQLAQEAHITVERKQGLLWSPVVGPTQLSAQNFVALPLPNHHTDDSERVAGLAYRVTSDVPVIVYQFNPLDGQDSLLSDASLLYPVAAWDHVNHAITYTGTVDNNAIDQHAYATVIAAADATTITITPSVATAAGPGVPAGQPGVPFDIQLDEGDGLTLAIQDLATSLSGTIFESDEDHPFALFAGHECALIPAADPTCCCDHLEEQIAGVRLWGTDFIAARLPVRRPDAPEPTLWQLYAAEHDTTITLDAAPDITGLPPDPILLAKGQVAELLVTGPPASPGDFAIHSDRPIAVMAYMIGARWQTPPHAEMEGDPASVQLVSIAQFLPRYVVLVPTTWNHDVGVFTRLPGATVRIDGQPIPDQDFISVGDHEVARVPLTDGVHRLDGDGTPFGVIIVGYDPYDSYAYLGGAGTHVLNPDPQ